MKRFILSVAVIGLASSPVLAEQATSSAPSAAKRVALESGEWHGKGVIVVVDKSAVKLDDSAGHAVTLSQYDGVVSNADGNAFLDKARYQVVTLLDTATSGGGYKTFTDPDGSKVFAKFAITERKPPAADGTFQFSSGTGKYQGISGGGSFHIVFISDKAAWDELVGNYKLPTPLAGASTPPSARAATSTK